MRTTLILALSAILLGGCPSGGKAPKGPKLEKIDSSNPNNPGPNFRNGMLLVKANPPDYAKAYDFFDRAAQNGGGPKASFNAGLAAERMGMSAEALRHYKAAYDADQTYQAALYSLASAYQAAGDATSAVALLKNELAKNPSNQALRTELVNALVKAKQYGEATNEAQEILRHDPKNAAVFRAMSAMYFDQGKLPMSQLTAEEALKLNEGDPGTYNNMGVSLLIQGKEPEAIEKFQRAVQLEASHFEANMNLGWVALNSGDSALAAASFKNALLAKPGSLDAKLGMAVALRGQGDFKGAGKLYDEIILANPKTEAAYFNAALMEEKFTKDFTKAQKYLESYIATHAVSPSHEVYGRIEEIKKAKAAEEERKRIEAERKKAEEERKRKAAEQFEKMKGAVSSFRTTVEANRDCLADGIDEYEMMIEQAQMAIDAEEADMAADILGLLEEYASQVTEVVAGCSGGGGSPEPTPEPEPAPE